MDEFENYSIEKKDKIQIKLLREINDKLGRIIELLEDQGRIRPG